MGVLGAALGLEPPGLFRVILLAVAALDKGSCRRQRLLRQPQGIGTHIGDKAHRAHALDVNALIELLGDGHGALGDHVQLPGRLLLEGGGGEGRRGGAVLILALHAGYCEGRILHSIYDALNLFPAGQLHPLFPAIELRLEPSQIGGDPGQGRGDGPVLLGGKSPDLRLPLHRQPGGHRLHPPRRQAPADLLPQQG